MTQDSNDPEPHWQPGAGGLLGTSLPKVGRKPRLAKDVKTATKDMVAVTQFV